MNKIELSMEQKEKKKQMLLDMKKELENLEYQKEHFKTLNIEICMLRIMKILLQSFKRLSPYIMTSIISFMIFKYFNHTPFIKDEIEKKLAIQKEFDSMRNIRYEMQYDDFVNNENRIEVFSSWKKTNDNFYEREIKVYYVNSISVERIEKIVDSNYVSLDSIFGVPDLIKTEKRNDLSEEEINSLPSVKGIVYLKSNETIQMKESDINNTGSTIAWILLNLLIDGFLSKLIVKPSFKTLMENIKKINDENPIIDKDELEKLIKLKQDNYNRLVR